MIFRAHKIIKSCDLHVILIKQTLPIGAIAHNTFDVNVMFLIAVKIFAKRNFQPCKTFISRNELRRQVHCDSTPYACIPKND